MQKFEDGLQLNAIWFEDESGWQVGNHGCSKITVSMQNGQMARVPWAIVERDDQTHMVNLAQVQSVEVAK